MVKNSTELKIAITGGAGYIGSFTTKYLKDKGFNNLVILDNFSQGHKEVCFSRYIEIDLLDKIKLIKIFKEENFDAVIHFAALALVPVSMENPYLYFHHNINSSLNLLETMKENKTKYIIFSSSCAVYGTPKTLPIREDAAILPESVYAETKAMIEKLIQWYQKLFNIKFAILRYFNACGATSDGSNGENHDPETHIIPCAINNLLQQKPIDIFGNDYPTPDKTCIRDYIHVEDLAEAHYLALKYIIEEEASDIFNLGVGRGYSNIEVAKAIIDEAKKYNLSGSFEFKPRRAGDPTILYADNSKIKKILNWQPKYEDIREIVKTAFKWHYKQSRK